MSAHLPHKSRLGRLALALGWLLVAPGCAWMRSSINDSPATRWWLFSHYGAEKICPRVLSSGVPLRMLSGGPVVGRYFPNECQSQVDDQRQLVSLAFGGSGFVWTPFAGRVGFRARAVVDYKMDFRLTDDAIYVFGTPVGASLPPQFALSSVENAVVNWATQGPAAYLATQFGGQLLQSRVGEGFTVIRTDNGDEFALGHLEPPARPPQPFALSGEQRVSLANETIEVHLNQVDLLGPFEVTEPEQALYLRWRVEGAPVEVLVYPRSTIEPWRQALEMGSGLVPPPQAPLTGWPLPLGERSDRLPLPPGQYVLVVDHSSRLGQVAPPWNPLGMLGGAAATLSVSVELGDASP